jgi:methylated-DNA-[protein]-cysteine S-methyltransferase
MTYHTTIESSIGPLLLTSDGTSLTGVNMTDQSHGPISGDWVEDPEAVPLPEAKRQLDAYFTGSLTGFDLPLAPAGTAFQQRVWAELAKMPYGATVSYGEIAERIGNPKAMRAVGLANGRNPISIVIPCHRVIGANGKLVGYGGGLPRKQWLLAHEFENPCR